MSDFEKLRDLPINVESFEFEANDLEYSAEFTRGSTIVHLNGDGHEGMGEDVAYEVLDHIANRDLGPRFDLTGPKTLGELCALLGELDLYEGAPPERDVSRDYRRWAYESAALDLALRQNGVPLHEAVGRDPKPLRFVCSTRLTASVTRLLRRLTRSRLGSSAIPGLEFKLDPENDWTPELIEEIAEVATVRVMDLKGYLQGHGRRGRDRSRALPCRRREVPGGLARGPRSDGRNPRGAEAPLGPAYLRRAAPLARRRQGARAGARNQLEALAIRLAGGTARRSTSTATRTASQIYGGGQGEVGLGRGQIQYLASLYHPDTSNDTPPPATTTPPSRQECRPARWTQRPQKPASAGASPPPPPAPPWRAPSSRPSPCRGRR